MFHKNLRYFRLKKGLTKKALADQANISLRILTAYENGERKPDMEALKSLAEPLGVRVSDFLAIRRNDSITHCEFRKNSTFSKSKQELVRESVEEYFSRFMTIVEISGTDVLPTVPECGSLALSDDDEENAYRLRKHLGFSTDGPLEELIGKLESKGILIWECTVADRNFSGMNGFVNGRPYIVINPSMSPERIRSTLAHELAHFMFIWPDDMSDKEIEDKATAISGAFLFSRADAIRELGAIRSSVTNAMTLIAKKYGISMMLLVKRSEIVKIIPKSVARNFFIRASKAGWRTGEPTRIEEEHPSLFQQLVYRAVNEQKISVQRGAELLQQPFDEVRSMCRLDEV